jgi:hypothetical protein
VQGTVRWLAAVAISRRLGFGLWVLGDLISFRRKEERDGAGIGRERLTYIVRDVVSGEQRRLRSGLRASRSNEPTLLFPFFFLFK